MTNVNETPIPADVYAEKVLLGAILLENTGFYDQTAEGIQVDDFSLDSHRMIFRAMAEMMDAGTSVDLVTLCNHLNAKGQIGAVGGWAYLASLTDGLPRKPQVGEYIKILREKSIARSLIAIGTTAVAQASTSSLSPVEAVHGAIAALETASAMRGSRSFSIGDILVADYPKFEAEANSQVDGTLGCDLFTPDLSRVTCGIQEGELCLLCARPGQGKTEAAIQTILHNAMRGKRIFMFSMEMSRFQVARRMVRYIARVPVRAMRDPRLLRPDQRQRINAARDELADLQIMIDDTHELTVQDYRSRAVLAAKRWKADLLVVDYAQLLLVPRAKNIIEAAPKQAETLRHISRDYCRTMALAQLRRSPPNDLNRFPDIEDILGSSAFEQAAQIILMLHRTRGEQKRYTGEDFCFIGKMRELQTIEPFGIKADECGQFHDRYDDNNQPHWQEER